MKFRQARVEDIEQIQNVEREYYEGFGCPTEMLELWINELSRNFIVAEENDRIVGFIFFEYLEKIKAPPFIHDIKNTHNPDGKYVYISEVGILDEYKDLMQKLFDKLVRISKKDKREKIVWLTGSKAKHDKIESKLLRKNNFTRMYRVKKWEAFPNFFVDDSL